MRNMVLFEDDPQSPISIMLQHVYNGEVDFCESCDLFESKICDYLDAGYDNIVCYFDTPPDNVTAVERYEKLRYKFECSDTVHVLKSQAIEHYVLKSFVNLGSVLRDNVMVRDFIKIQSGLPVSYSDDSYEGFCKNVLNGNKRSCVRNKKKVIPSWYKTDCCPQDGNAYCQADRNSLDQKRLILMWALPYYPAYQKDEYLRKLGYLLNTSIEKSEELCNEEFEKIKKAVCKE